MGSKNHCQGLASTVGQGYAVPLELSPQPSTSLEEQRRTWRASVVRSEMMGTRTQSDGELPLEELLTLYGYDMSHAVLQQHRQFSQTADTPPTTTTNKIAPFSGEDDGDTLSSSDDITASVTSHTADILQCHLRVQNLQNEVKDTVVISSDDDSDSTSVPSSDGRKDIMVGPQYQAIIPQLNSYSCCEREYENEDQLLWTPEVLSPLVVEEYLLHVQRQLGQDRIPETMTSGDLVKDNEQALYELVRCNFNTEEALRRLRFNVKVFSEELCAWSEEECRNFEHGYRAHGKNFHLIQANKVRTRSVGECVQYYYMWKKSELHDCFTQQSTRLGRKRFALQSGNIEDGDADADQSEADSSSRPPTPAPVLQVETSGGRPEVNHPGTGPSTTETYASLPPKALSPPHTDRTYSRGPPGAAMKFREKEPLTHSQSGLQREPLYSSFSTVPPLQELRRPDDDCVSRDGSVTSLSTDFYTPSPPCQPETNLLGTGLYQLQLGSIVEDDASVDTRFRGTSRIPTDFTLPTTATPPPTISRSIVVPEFEAVGNFVCPSSALCLPSVLEPRSLMP